MSLRTAHPYFITARAVMNGAWSPIGLVPEDEYDSWTWQVVRLLRSGVARSELAAYLAKARGEILGESAAEIPISDDFEAADALIRTWQPSDYAGPQ